MPRIIRSVRAFWYKNVASMVKAGRPPAKLRFAHVSEANFARFLDFHRIEWRYEPVCFPLDRDAEGRVIRSFTPDFYLPQFELYVELTTMKQSLVTPKNRKIRQMRQLYPDLKLKVLYGRDYRKLLFKFGVLA